MFVLASSVSKSLQCLISTLTRGGKGGPLFRLTCSIVMWRGRDTQTNAASMCGECLQRMDHAGFPQRRHALPRPAMLWLQRALQVHCPLWGDSVSPLFHALPRSKLLRFSGAPQGHRPRWAVCFVPFSGPSHSDSWVLGECPVPDGPCVLGTSLVLAARFLIDQK